MNQKNILIDTYNNWININYIFIRNSYTNFPCYFPCSFIHAVSIFCINRCIICNSIKSPVLSPSLCLVFIHNISILWQSNHAHLNGKPMVTLRNFHFLRSTRATSTANGVEIYFILYSCCTHCTQCIYFKTSQN